MSRPHMELREWCTLIGDECNWNHCEGCPNNVPRLTKQEENLLECEFVSKLKITKILPSMVNRANTLAKASIGDELDRFIQKQGLSKVTYAFASFNEYPLLPMLRSTLKLGIPDETYIAKHKVCVIVYGDIAYIIAPYHD